MFTLIHASMSLLNRTRCSRSHAVTPRAHFHYGPAAVQEFGVQDEAIAVVCPQGPFLLRQ
jgi:hypothetical protein